MNLVTFASFWKYRPIEKAEIEIVSRILKFNIKLFQKVYIK